LASPGFPSMCFYKDTQAAIGKNSLRQFFLRKVRKAEPQLKDTFLAKQEEGTEEDTEEPPYKKVHLNGDLFKDLLKLSAGQTFNESDDSEDQYGMHGELAPEAKTLTPTSSLKELNALLMMIDGLNQKVQRCRDDQAKFEGQVEELAKQAKIQDFEESPFERLNKMSYQQKTMVRLTSKPSTMEMLAKFTKGRTDFPYALKLSMKLPSIIIRERNIKIGVQLVRTSDGSLIEDHGSMLLQVSLHTWELPSNLILRNKAGNKILQGEDKCELKNGKGCFDKLQINEVTSKFINGYVGIFVVAKRPINFGTSLGSLQQKRLIEIQDIQPILIEKVIVKSKKKNQTVNIVDIEGKNLGNLEHIYP